MRIIAVVMLAVMVGGSIASTQAQDKNDARRNAFLQRFAAANTTHDGCLTREQAIAGHVEGVVRDFDAIDTARRGCITVDQIMAFRSKLAHNFATANVTHDGCLTHQQAIDGKLKRVAKEFPNIDVTHRGCVTLDEIRTYFTQNTPTLKAIGTHAK